MRSLLSLHKHVRDVAALEALPGWKWEEEDPFPGMLEKLKKWLEEDRKSVV